jgi:hypothetical protein
MQAIANSLPVFSAWGRRIRILSPCSCSQSFFGLFELGFVVSLVDHGPQSHVSIVPTTHFRFVNGVATATVRRRSREGGRFFVVGPRPRPSRLPREVFSGFQEAIGPWIIMNAGDIPVNFYNHYRVMSIFLFQKRGSLSLKVEEGNGNKKKIFFSRNIAS